MDKDPPMTSHITYKIEAMTRVVSHRVMEDHTEFFNYAWRGWYNRRGGVSQEDRDAITSSRAKCYNDLLNEAIKIKEAELRERGGKPFYEPSTFYGSFNPAFYHDNPEGAASRYASNIFSTFSRYTAHKCKDIRIIPEERDEYGLRLWRISHPEPLSKPVHDLWTITNQVAATEPWAWPMMIGLLENYYTQEAIQKVPVLRLIQEMYMALGYTEGEFLSNQKEIWTLLEWDQAKNM